MDEISHRLTAIEARLDDVTNLLTTLTEQSQIQYAEDDRFSDDSVGVDDPKYEEFLGPVECPVPVEFTDALRGTSDFGETSGHLPAQHQSTVQTVSEDALRGRIDQLAKHFRCEYSEKLVYSIPQKARRAGLITECMMQYRAYRRSMGYVVDTELLLARRIAHMQAYIEAAFCYNLLTAAERAEVAKVGITGHIGRRMIQLHKRITEDNMLLHFTLISPTKILTCPKN